MQVSGQDGVAAARSFHSITDPFHLAEVVQLDNQDTVNVWLQLNAVSAPLRTTDACDTTGPGLNFVILMCGLNQRSAGRDPWCTGLCC